MLAKPSKLERAVAKYTKRQAAAKAKHNAERTRRREWTATRHRLFVRDNGRCRVLGLPLKLASDNPTRVAHLHHIKFRSLGGSNDDANLIVVSLQAHDMVHRHELEIDGDANGLLTFTQRDPKTGRVVRVWEG